MKKTRIPTVFACFSLVCLVLFLVSTPVFAEEFFFDGSSNNWNSFFEQLPPELQSELGEISFEEPIEAAGELSKKFTVSYWIEKITCEIEAIFFPSLKNALAIFGMLIIIASIKPFSEDLMSNSFGKVFELCSDLCIASVIVVLSEGIIGMCCAYLDRLCGIINVMIPVTEGIYLIEGSLTQLSVHKTAMLLYIGITSNLNNLVLRPMFGVLFGFTISGSIFHEFGFNGFVEGFKKALMTVISVFTLLFSFVLGIQTVLARSADSLGMKTARLFLGSFIPIIGGTMAEALTTLKEGIGLIRSVVGIGGIVLLLLLILPVLCSILVNSLLLSFCHMAADIMGCGNSAKIIDSFKSVLTILAAVVCATTLLFIMALILFVKVGNGA
ncbi:MAG: hypothetical protein E7399_09700 [Ruminococcaceae bacterium]|nr:hypothetical protein [Oscillospiraceae bacterium]